VNLGSAATTPAAAAAAAGLLPLALALRLSAHAGLAWRGLAAFFGAFVRVVSVVGAVTAVGTRVG
jgi:hypothetical protein